jgi:hypothetical protein
MPAQQLGTDPEGVVVEVRFTVSTNIAEVGEGVVVTDTGRNLTSLSWGDGSLWMFEDDDEPQYVATHVYKKAGVYTIEGIDLRTLPDGSKEIGSGSAQIIIVGPNPDPEPDPVPEPVGFWQALWNWLVGIKNAILGRK